MSKVSEKLIKVFVYGTLKRGEPNHHWLTRPENGHARFVGEAKTIERFPLVIGTRYNIPFLLDKRGVGHNIIGEVYEVDDAMFANLDILEDYPKYYDRELQAVATANETLQCWLYLIRSFPEALLAKQHLESYHNRPAQAYCERSKRDANIKALEDLGYLDSSSQDLHDEDEHHLDPPDTKKV